MKKGETKTLVRAIKSIQGNSLVVQLLGLQTSIVGATSSIPGWGTGLHKLCGQ